MLEECIGITHRGIVIRCPDDVLTCSTVKKQLVKYAVSQPKQIILFYINAMHILNS